MTPFNPLSDDELQELDHFLLHEVEAEETMTLDVMDGYLHAIAIGPTTIYPRQWLPPIWGGQSMVPAMDALERVNHILGLVMRHYNGIIAGFDRHPPAISPIWSTLIERGHVYDEAESWCLGFIEGMQLCWKDWQPMLETPQGQKWFRPIDVLGGEDDSDARMELIKTPARRSKLAQQIPASILAMHAYWLPFREAVHERETAKVLQDKVGRNDPCPCDSGEKFKKCCGAAANLQ